ncbi:MAG TPA: CHASE3 domain-containing protein [Candidatus Acidoferrales bacterium]|nr:CHASE3 domain-containing protein [Candidatus Acidoferrales bacterium]
MTFRSKITAGFGTALAILILMGVLTYRSSVRDSEDRVWVAHTERVREQIDAVLTDLLNAETGERGFILTGEVSFLKPYIDGLERIDADVKALRDLTSDNPIQQKALDLAGPLISERLGMLRDRIEERKLHGLISGAEVVRQGPGKENMDKIRADLAEMKEEENRLLRLRTEESVKSSRITRIVIVTGEGLGFAFLCLAGIVVAQEMQRRRHAEEEIRKLNTDLEQRVADRTGELAERAKDLARSNSELQQFAYVASHDLQEPLRMVASFTQLLAKRYADKLDEDARDFIQYAVDGATRMQTLIADLLNYSRVGTQGKPLVPTETEAVLKDVLESLKYTVEKSGAAISHDPLPWVLADPVQLGQLFQNLLTNAIKFHGEDPPRVHISAARNGNAWIMAVRDNGIGIAQEQADRIFVIFQRLHTKTEYPGTGIGLAICKKIVERHGGRIWIEPTPGGGTTFRFTISAADPRIEEKESNGLRMASYAN